MLSRIEIQKVGSDGKIQIQDELFSGVDEVIIIRRKNTLRIIPRKKGDLTRYFDTCDLGGDTIDDWGEFERKFWSG